MHIHRPAYVGQLYANAYFELVYACRREACARRHALKNPNPENKNTKTKQNLKRKF